MHHWLITFNFHPGLPPIGRRLKAILCHNFETRTLEQGSAGQMRSHICYPKVVLSLIPMSNMRRFYSLSSKTVHLSSRRNFC
ncbi:hypothetical protein FDUTEX481_07650 [Tolypothrix sp. PCC 7601]|nr:hypothetical protein FDUTEX481_07650 [Tolypothrix sp. PCC 7601]